MAKLDEFSAASRRAAERRANEPFAVAARYDRRRDRIVVRLNTGVELAFPAPYRARSGNSRAIRLGRYRDQPLRLRRPFSETRCASLSARAGARRVRFQEMDGGATRRRRRQGAQPRQERRRSRQRQTRRPAA